MAAAHDDDDPGFWPGYVAAVSGLVQGLLIMAMALATAILALGQLAKGRADSGVNAAAPAGALRSGLEPRAAGPTPPALAPALPSDPVPPLVPPNRLAPGGPAPAGPHSAKEEAPPPQISAGFQGDAVTIPTSAIAPLLASVDAAQSAGARRWRISIAADLRDPRQQRAAYLRLLGLRSLMVQHGVPASMIDLWIESGAAGELSREARIDPLDGAGPAIASGGRP